jgi:hypothetical protein
MAVPALVFLGLFAGVALGGVQKSNNFGGDDVGSMPGSAAPDDPSLMLYGKLADLNAAILSVAGPGEVKMRPIVPGSDRILVEFEGTLSVALDTRVLATGNVRMIFGIGTTFAGGTASVYAQGAWARIDDLQPLVWRDLSLGFLANDVSPTLIHADAVTGERFSLLSTPIDGAVLVRQSVR